jgi:uncharacterized radical SAM superfamily Fe-S cluster-containing enzyme
MMRYSQEFVIQSNSEGLPNPVKLNAPVSDKTVDSLCPVCLKVVKARIFLEGDAVMMEKRCKDHGKFRDLYWSDARLYSKFMRYLYDGNGVENPDLPVNCPFDCGLCSNHKTSTLLANIDL